MIALLAFVALSVALVAFVAWRLSRHDPESCEACRVARRLAEYVAINEDNREIAERQVADGNWHHVVTEPVSHTLTHYPECNARCEGDSHYLYTYLRDYVRDEQGGIEPGLIEDAEFKRTLVRDDWDAQPNLVEPTRTEAIDVEAFLAAAAAAERGDEIR